MKTIARSVLVGCMALVISVVFIACERESAEEVKTLKVGIIASLTGPGSSWGYATLNTAQVIADYYNNQGGYEINRKRYIIELIVEDDALDPNQAIDAVEKLVYEDRVKLIIGPLGDDAVVAVAPILDASKVIYLHYGFESSLMRENSSGILGMPIPMQTLPLIYNYLMKQKGVRSISVLARNSSEALRQKIIAEEVATETGLTVHRFSQFDILEETLQFVGEGLELYDPIQRVIESKSDAVILTGIPPEHMVKAVAVFRELGYSGLIVAQNSQDVSLLMKQGSAAEGVIFVGGQLPVSSRSPYFHTLKRNYLDQHGVLSAEVVTKFYALETLLNFVRYIGGPNAISKRDLFMELNQFTYPDPFFLESRIVRLVGMETFNAKRQLSTPIIISEIIDGASRSVEVAELPK